MYNTNTTHMFNDPFSGTTQVCQYQKGKTNQDFTEARESEWQWHQLGHMQVCTLLQINTKKLKPGLVAFNNIRPDNGADLFSKEKISKGGDK